MPTGDTLIPPNGLKSLRFLRKDHSDDQLIWLRGGAGIAILRSELAQFRGFGGVESVPR